MNDLDALTVVHPNAAGLDIGSREIWAAIRPDHPGETVRRFAAIPPRWDAPAELPELPPAKPDSKTKNKPADSTRAELFRITGVDLVAVDGISASLAMTILSEVGTDISRFPTEKHFCSWLGLAPHNDISGGMVLRSRTLKTDNRAGQAFRQAAASVTRSQSAFGAFYRRKKAQLKPSSPLPTKSPAPST